ncbi:MAG: hypothetical protein V1754_11345 [Pseudomonadota bacterium]
MAELRLLSLEESLNADQFQRLLKFLADHGVGELPPEGDDLDLDDALSEDQLADFMDRLEAHDAACDIYLPVEFEETIKIGERTVGSVYSLVVALEEVREELDLEGEGDELADDEIRDLEVIEQQLRFAWHAFARAANACVKNKVPLHVIP